MKRLFMGLFFLLGAFVACEQEEPIPPSQEEQEEIGLDRDTLTVVIPQDGEVLFTASTESPADSPQVRTTIEGPDQDGKYQVNWVKNDSLDVFWVDSDGAKSVKVYAADNGPKTSFAAKVTPSKEYWAGYPSGATVRDFDAMWVSIPSQTAGLTFDQANIAIAYTDSTAKDFAFKNVCALMKLTVNRDNVRKVVVRGGKNEILSGKFTVTLGEDGLPVLTPSKDASDSIAVSVPGPGTYYVPVSPLASLENYTVTVANEAGRALRTIFSSKSLSLGRSLMSVLADFDRVDYFVSPEGAGDRNGMSWEDALPFAQMCELLALNRPSESKTGNISSGNTEEGYLAKHNVIHAEQVNGVNWHLLEGDYASEQYLRISFPGREEQVKINVFGGYSAASKGMDLSQRDAAEFVTRITRPAEGAAVPRHMYILDYVDADFDGITFHGGEGEATAGGGSLLYRPSDFNSEVKFTNCIFDGNTAGCGGAISQRNGHLVIENCRFVGNSTTTETVTGNAQSQGGGCIYVGGEKNAAASKAKLTIIGCVFGGENEADPNTSGYTGSAVTFHGAELSVSNSAFTNNKANYSGTLALYEGTVSVYGCTFTGNTIDHDYGAGIMTSAETLTVSDTDFTGNVAKTYGGAIASMGGTSYLTDGCTFTGNCSTERETNVYGGAVYVSGTSTVNIDDATFVDNYVVNNSESESAKAFGGAITVNSGSTLTLSNSTISRPAENTTLSSISGGGAVSVHASSSATLENVTISNCETSGDGGAFYVDASTLVVKGSSSIKGCTAAVSGGVGYIKGAAVCSMAGGEILGNTAVNGGVVRLAAGEISFSSVTFEANAATAGGGVVYNDNGRFLADKCHFDGNNSVSQGGVVRNGTTANNPESFFNSCSFTKNYTTGNTQCGDVFYAKGGTIGVNNCAIYANGGTNQSGDIVLASSETQVPTLVVVNSTFYKNPEGYDFNGTTKYGIMYSYANDSHVYYLNNVLLKPDSSALKVGSGSATSVEVSGGFNYRGTLHVTNGCTYTALGNEIEVKWDDVKNNFSLVDNGYQWTGLSDAEATGYSKATLTNITDVLNNDSKASGFYTWLKTLSTTDPLTVDFYGNPRDTDAMWPGCYQGK